MKPSSVWLRGFKGERIVQEITVRAHEDLPLVLNPIKFPLSDKVDYEIKTLEEGRVFRLTFRDKLNRTGKYRGVLQLTTNYPGKPMLRIRINGDIKGSLQVTPDRLHFGRLNTAKLTTSNTKVLVRSLKVKSIRGDHFKIEKVDYNRDLFEVNIQEVQAGQIYNIELKLPVKKIKPGRLSEKLTIHTNLEDEKLKVINILGYVKNGK